MKCTTKRMAGGGKVRVDNMPDWAKQVREDERLAKGSERAYNKASTTPPAPKPPVKKKAGGAVKRPAKR